MKLHQKKSYLVSQEEGRPAKRKWAKVTQLLYILFIVCIFLYIIYFFFARSFYVKTDGVIEVAKQRIAATHGGKLETFSLQHGERFIEGDTLAVVGAGRFCRAASIDTRPAQLAFSIEDEEVDLRGLVKEYALLKRMSDASKQGDTGIRRALEVNAPLLRNPEAENFKLIEKQNEIDIKRLRIANLQERLRLHQNTSVPLVNDPACSAQTILAPFSGYVFSTTFVQGEVANRGETIMTIVADTAEVNVEIFLENALFDSAQPQQRFDVVLPNGDTSKAVVSEIFSSAVTQAEREFRGYDPIIPQLKAHLVPVDENDIAVWKSYDRYRVNVKGLK